MNVKKVTNKDRYGNQVTVEYESPEKQLDPTKLMEKQMEMMQDIPMAMTPPPVGGEEFVPGNPNTHPGGPKGKDTVPAWLTPGEFVVNAEAMSIPENAAMVEQINEQGRMMQQGGQVPNGGLTTNLDMTPQYRNLGGALGFAVLPNPHLSASPAAQAGLGAGLGSVDNNTITRDQVMAEAYRASIPTQVYDKGFFGFGRGFRDLTEEEIAERQAMIDAGKARADKYFQGKIGAGHLNEGGVVDLGIGDDAMDFVNNEVDIAMPIPRPAREVDIAVPMPRPTREVDIAVPMPRPEREADIAMPISYQQALLEEREGYRPEVYLDSLGKPTVGHGHLLPDEYASQVGETPFSEEQLGNFFSEDMQKAEAAARRNVGDELYDGLNRQQRAALTSMAFQLGESGQGKFKNMIAALKRGDHDAVAREALSGSSAGTTSKWYQQTPKRALDLAAAFSPEVAAQYQNDGGSIEELWDAGYDDWKDVYSIKRPKFGTREWHEWQSRLVPKTQEEGFMAWPQYQNDGGWLEIPTEYLSKITIPEMKLPEVQMPDVGGWISENVGFSGSPVTQQLNRSKNMANELAQYRFDGGYLQEQLAADPETNAAVQEHMASVADIPYGWNVAEGRPYTQEEGMAAGTVAEDVPAPVVEEERPWWAGEKYNDPYATIAGDMGNRFFTEEDMGEGSAADVQDQEAAAISMTEEYQEAAARAKATGKLPPSPTEWAAMRVPDEVGQSAVDRMAPMSDNQEIEAQEAAAAAVNDAIEAGATPEEAAAVADEAANANKPKSKEEKDHDAKAFFEELMQETDDNEDDPSVPGDTGQQTEDQVEQAGKQEAAKPGMMQKAKGFFESLGIGDLFDDGELSRMAVMYLGSRALGYSHGGSLRWSAKNYLNRVDAKSANRASQAAEFAKSGKYTPQSVANFKKSGNLGDLIAVGASYTPTGKSQVKMINGKKVPLMEVKGSDGGIYYQGPNGNILNAGQIATARDYEPSFDKGTPEYRERRSRATRDAGDRFKEIRTQNQSFDNDGRPQYATKIGPQQASDEFWAWSESMGLDPESDEALTIMTNAYQQAINDGKSGALTPTKLRPYLENEYIRERTGSPELFMTNNPKPGEQPQYVRGDKMSVLNQNVEYAASQLPGLQGLAPQDASSRMYDLAIGEWNKLGPDGQKLYNKSAEKGESGFYVFMNKRMAQLLQKL